MQFWCVHFQKDIEKLERVQKTAIKIIQICRKFLAVMSLKSSICLSYQKDAQGVICLQYNIHMEEVDTTGTLISERKTSTNG